MAYSEVRTPSSIRGVFDGVQATTGGIGIDEGDKLLFIGVGSGWTGTVQIKVTCNGLEGKYGSDITTDNLTVIELPAQCVVNVECSAFTAGTYTYVLKK